MITLPAEIMPIMQAFAPVFSERIWDWVKVLLAGEMARADHIARPDLDAQIDALLRVLYGLADGR